MNKHVLATAIGTLFAHPQAEAQETPATPANPSTTPPPTEAQMKKNRKAAAAKGKAKMAKPAKAKKASGKSGSNKGLEGPAVLKKYAPDYQKGGKDGKAKTAAGNVTIDNADKLADKLRGKTLDEVYTLAVETLNKGLEEGEKAHTKKSLMDKYAKLNAGMQRMNLGNRMRAVLGLSKSGK